MIHAPRLTLPRLLDLVEGRLHRFLPGRTTVPTRAYAAARSGAVSVIDVPPARADDLLAVAAILAIEMAKRRTMMFVLARAREDDLIHLVGERLGRHPARQERLLLIHRSGRKIGGLERVAPAGRADAATPAQRWGARA